MEREDIIRRRGSVGDNHFWEWGIKGIKGDRHGVIDEFWNRFGEEWYGKIVNYRTFGGKLWVLFFVILNIHFQFSDMILTCYIYANAHYINLN